MKRPWNRVDLPVYSISSTFQTEENMHICTYVSAVSMTPKRMMVAIYKGTKTLEITTKNSTMILQLLSEKQYNLINLLGQHSGFTTNKVERLKKRNLIKSWKNFSVLKEALSYLELNTIGRIDAGDHILHICDVLSFCNNLPGEPLTLDLLRKKKLIRG